MGYREEYRELTEQLIQLANLEGRQHSLKQQQKELEKKVLDLELQKDAEQRDVEKLEGRSLSKLFYAVTGQLKEQMDKEKQEAYAAAVKYDAAACELDAVKKDLTDIGRSLSQLRGCKERYQELLKQRQEELKALDTPEGEQILKLEEEIAVLESRQKEIREALSAGSSALNLAEDVLKELNTAQNYGAWDVLGGGLLVDMAKHSALDAAQKKVEALQLRLRRFRTELADVSVQADMKVNIEGFDRFADYFFDGLFADWMAMNKISNSKAQAASTVEQLKTAVRNLESLERSTEGEIRSRKGELEEIIKNS